MTPQQTVLDLPEGVQKSPVGEGVVSGGLLWVKHRDSRGTCMGYFEGGHHYLQSFGHLMRRVDLLEKTLMLGGIGGIRRRGRQRMRWLDEITNLMNMSLGKSGSW